MKNPFEKLPPEFTDAVQNMTVAEMNARISTVAKGEQDNQTAKENDEALEEAKAKASELGAPYSDATKMNKLKIKYLYMQIKAKGGQ